MLLLLLPDVDVPDDSSSAHSRTSQKRSWRSSTAHQPPIIAPSPGIKRTHIILWPPLPTPSLLLLPPQIPIDPNPVQSEVEESLGRALGVPHDEIVGGGAELEVGDVRGEDGQAVKDVRCV